jgi:hypothetical protein
MKRVIKLTEKDIAKLVMESLNEIGWQTPNDLYDEHREGAHYLDMFASDLRNFIEKWTDEYTEEWNYNNINRVKDPLREKVFAFINQANKMADWCERKAAQIEGFEQASEDKFKQENGMSMEDYSNEYWDKDDKLFNQYIDDEIDDDTYSQSQADLKKNYPEIDNISRH